MPNFHLDTLDRRAYNDSIEALGSDRSVGFARVAREWWDRHFSWKTHGCVVLCDETGNHLSYIFYVIDRYREYLTIHNIFTPECHRRQGHARTLLSAIFAHAGETQVERFRLSCVPQSLEFYTTLGFIYWGVNSVGDFYCDLPLPDTGLEGVAHMVEAHDDTVLLGSHMRQIRGKVHGNASELSDDRHDRYEAGREFLGGDYRYDTLMEIAEAA
jgi:GNAT superfamily N-acetyltransferase